MAYLAATDVTVTLTPQDFDRSPGDGIGFRTFPQVDYGDGVLQYPALGIPMPAIGNFGFNFALRRVYIEQPANGFIYAFDRANQKLRIFLGAAQAAVTVAVANHVGVAPTGNVAAPAFTGDAMANLTPTGNVAAPSAHVGVAPTGNVAAPGAHVGVAPTGNVANTTGVSAGTPTGNIANASTDFVGDLIADAGVNYTPTGNIANISFEGDALPTHTHGAQAFTGDTPANFTHNAPAFTGDVPANLSHNAPAFTGDAKSPGTPTGNVAAPAFTGDAMANLTHTVTVTGGSAVAEAALAEMDDGVAPAATTLYMEMLGR